MLISRLVRSKEFQTLLKMIFQLNFRRSQQEYILCSLCCLSRNHRQMLQIHCIDLVLCCNFLTTLLEHSLKGKDYHSYLRISSLNLESCLLKFLECILPWGCTCCQRDSQTWPSWTNLLLHYSSQFMYSVLLTWIVPFHQRWNCPQTFFSLTPKRKDLTSAIWFHLTFHRTLFGLFSLVWLQHCRWCWLLPIFVFQHFRGQFYL